jgi:hypothetical protein
VNRRTFLARSFLLPFAGELVRQPHGSMSIPLTLVPSAGVRGQELVNIGVPFPRGRLFDAARISVVDDHGRTLPVNVRVLERWRTPPDRPREDESIRAVQIQFPISLQADRRGIDGFKVLLGDRARAASDRIEPVEKTLSDKGNGMVPRIVALLPAEWLCASEVAGPQTLASASGQLAEYDRFVQRSFPASLQYVDSGVYHHWLFDRSTAYYTQYVRTGDKRFLDAAYRAAQFVRLHTATEPPDAGMFTLKGADVKYVYPRAMHIHWVSTGDDRALAAGAVMARFCQTRWDPVYRPDTYTQPPLGTDPEQGRPFWSTRHEAYGLLGVLHGWQMTGEDAYWQRVLQYLDALAGHQAQPPDGRAPDGSWRQNWALYDPNETLLAGGASAWMTAILLGALFETWLVTGDERIPRMVTRWCDFLDRKGFVPDGSRVHYVIDCFGSDHLSEAPGEQEQGMERHSTELAFSFAMGHFFSREPAQRQRFRKRFDRLFAIATTIDANRPARCYNWAFQSSSQLVYFMSVKN